MSGEVPNIIVESIDTLYEDGAAFTLQPPRLLNLGGPCSRLGLLRAHAPQSFSCSRPDLGAVLWPFSLVGHV